MDMQYEFDAVVDDLEETCRRLEITQNDLEETRRELEKSRNEVAELKEALKEPVAFLEESIAPPRSIGWLPRRQRDWLLMARSLVAEKQ